MVITDSASTPVTATSAYTAATTINAVLAPTLTATNTVNIDQNQFIAFTANTNGGSPGAGFTYNYIISNSVTNLQLFSNTVVTTSVSNTFTWQANALYVGNSIRANVIITDTANTPVTANSVYTAATTIHSQPTIILYVQSANGVVTNSIALGDSFTINAVVNGGSAGTGNFLYTWTLNGAAAVSTNTVNTLISSNTLTVPIVGVYAYNVIATDNGVATPDAISQISNVVVVGGGSIIQLTSSASGSTSYGYFDTPSLTFTGTATVSNQLQWNLYVNGALYGTTNSAITWTIGSRAGLPHTPWSSTTSATPTTRQTAFP